MEKTTRVGSRPNVHKKTTIENDTKSKNHNAVNGVHVESPQYINQISKVLKNKENAEKCYLKSLLAVICSVEILKNMTVSDAMIEIVGIMNRYSTKVYWTESGDVVFGASLKYSNGELARADRESLVEIVNGIIHDKQPFQITIRDLIDSNYTPEDNFDKIQIVSISEECKKVSCLNIIKKLEQELGALKDFPENKQEVEHKVLFCLREMFKIHPFQDANGRIIGSFLFYIISMKYNLPLISVVNPFPLLGMFTIEKLFQSYRIAQENFADTFKTHENYLHYLVSSYLEICHERPKIQADEFAKLIIKYGFVNKLLQESDKITHIIDCLLAIEHNVTEIDNNTLKNIMINTVTKLGGVSLDYLSFFQKMITDISKKDFNLLVRRSATSDIFEPILLFLLDDSKKKEFKIDLEATSQKGKTPLQIAQDFKAVKIVDLIKSKM